MSLFLCACLSEQVLVRTASPSVCVCMICSGPPHTVRYVERLQSYLSSLQHGTLATLTGRYYAMDRDKRYERTKLAYEGLVKGQGERVSRDDLIQVNTPL